MRRGLLFPSPVVMLSIIAVAMAAIAFVATRGGEPTERVITPVAEPTPSLAPTPTAEPSEPSETETEKAKPAKPAVQRDKIYVEVYNNSGISGLAGRVADRATDVGWSVVGSDNWYGTIPTTTVYFPPRLQRAAQLLARDLGVKRTAPAVGAMRMDRLTLILTDELG